MTNKKLIIVDAKTKKTTKAEISKEDFEEKTTLEAKHLAQKQAAAAKQAKLESAKAKLTALGLDEAEVAVMLGID